MGLFDNSFTTSVKLYFESFIVSILFSFSELREALFKNNMGASMKLKTLFTF